MPESLESDLVITMANKSLNGVSFGCLGPASHSERYQPINRS